MFFVFKFPGLQPSPLTPALPMVDCGVNSRGLDPPVLGSHSQFGSVRKPGLAGHPWKNGVAQAFFLEKLEKV